MSRNNVYGISEPVLQAKFEHCGIQDIRNAAAKEIGRNLQYVKMTRTNLNSILLSGLTIDRLFVKYEYQKAI